MNPLAAADNRMTVPRGFLSSFVGEDRPITVDEACAIKLLLFGDTTKTFGVGWKRQGFEFRVSPSYGIRQRLSGPCGLLGAVQGFVLSELLFGFSRCVLDDGRLNPDDPEKKEALARALTTILWQAGDYKQAVLALDNNKIILDNSVSANVLARDGTIEHVRLRYFRSRDGLLEHLYNNIGNLKRDGGVILFLYSLMLTHGIDKMKEEMDSPDIRLIGTDEYCSQELVNLAVTGRAVSNCFDGEVVIESECDDPPLVCKGISQQSTIGLLSSTEYENIDYVGTYLKDPKYPIWVVYGNMHYTVLFGNSRDIFKYPARPFKLFHYNGHSLRNADECFAIKPNELVEEAEKNKYLPIFIKCIYTRWPLATLRKI